MARDYGPYRSPRTVALLGSMVFAGSVLACTPEKNEPRLRVRDTGTSDEPGPSYEEDARVEAAVDASRDAPRVDVCEEAIFCEDFEGSEVDPALEWITLNTGKLSLERTRVHRGSGSLRADFTSSEAISRAYVATNSIPNLASGAVHARAYLYFPSASKPTDLSIMAVRELGGDLQGVRLALEQDGIVTLRITTAGMEVASSSKMPRDTWTCVELEVQVDPTAGSAKVWIDGTQSTSQAGVDTVPTTGAYHRAELGMLRMNVGQPDVSLWFDDFVVADGPIGCE